jgi:hypothetical protein
LLRQLAEQLGLAMIISREAVRVLSTTVFSHCVPGVEDRVPGDNLLANCCAERLPVGV